MGHNTENQATLITNLRKKEQERVVWTWEKEKKDFKNH